MTFNVFIQPSAESDIHEAVGWIKREFPSQSGLWLQGLKEQIMSLADFPKRGGLAPEDGVFKEEIRQILYGKGQNVYRILYTVQEKAVHVLHVRHGARRILRP